MKKNIKGGNIPDGSARFVKAMNHIKNKRKEKLGKTVFLKHLYQEFFDVGEMAINRWRKEYKQRLFPPTILEKLEVLKKEGINTPDYFLDVDAPMLTDDRPKEPLTIEGVREILKDESDKDILKEILKQLKILTEETRKNNALREKLIKM